MTPHSEIFLQRKILTPISTIGTLDVFGEVVWTLEDTKRKHKVFGETRIPAGRYQLNLRTDSHKFAHYYERFAGMHKGMIWLRHVPQFDYIYIHPLNTADETLGCIGVGLTHGTDRIISSVAAYRRIYGPIIEAIETSGCYIIIEDEDNGSTMVE